MLVMYCSLIQQAMRDIVLEEERAVQKIKMEQNRKGKNVRKYQNMLYILSVKYLDRNPNYDATANEAMNFSQL